MKTKILMTVVVFAMSGLVLSVTAKSASPKNKTDVSVSYGMADYTYVEDVEICKQVGAIGSDGRPPLSCKRASLYMKDNQYYVQTPESTARNRMEPAFKNSWYRSTNPSIAQDWRSAYEFKAGDWYFNL